MLAHHHKLFFTAAAALSALFCSPVAAAEQQWGDIHGQIIVKGVVPEGRPNAALVDRKTSGLANVAVYLDMRGKTTATHPSYEASAEALVKIMIKEERYQPRMTLLRTTQSLQIVNMDEASHNPHVQTISNSPIGILIPPDRPPIRHYRREERLPLPVTCNIDRNLVGWTLIRNSPYMAKTNSAGRFTIRNAPTCELTFRLWHERVGYLRNLEFGDLKTDKYGKLSLHVQPGDNRLPAIVLEPKHFFDDRVVKKIKN